MSIPSVIVLTDYRGFFETKQKSKIYRGGMDLELLGQHFKTNGFEFQVHSFINLNYQDLLKTKPYILYTSAEDKYGYYKSFIEDIVFHLENVGLKTLPEYRYLKAHNNKVSMELLREESDFQAIKTIKSHCFGTLEELKSHLPGFNYPILNLVNLIVLVILYILYHVIEIK